MTIWISLPITVRLWSVWLLLRLFVLSKELEREFSIVNSAWLISIIVIKEWLKLFVRVVHSRLLKHFAELSKVDVALVHNIKEFEHFDEAGFLGQMMVRSLYQLILQIRLKPTHHTPQKSISHNAHTKNVSVKAFCILILCIYENKNLPLFEWSHV